MDGLRNYLKTNQGKALWNFTKLLIIIVLIGGLLYIGLHELAHFTTGKAQGYSPYFNVTLHIIPKVDFPIADYQRMPANHLAEIAVSPYVFSTFLLAVLLVLFATLKKRYIFYLAILPFLDTVVNIVPGIPFALMYKETNDFLVLKAGGYYPAFIFFSVAPVILFAIIAFLYYKGKK